jgi:hypothetical protein
VLIALISQLLVVILKYLTGLLLSVEEVLHVNFLGPQLLDTSLKLCNQLDGGDLPPSSATGNPNDPLQHAKRSIDMMLAVSKTM